MYKSKTFSLLLHAIIVVAVLFIFFGENAFSSDNVFRIVLSLIGAIGLFFSVGSRLFILVTAEVNKRIHKRYLCAYIMIVVAFILYYLQADFVIGWSKEALWEQDAIKSYQAILTGLYPILFVVSMLYIIFVETTYYATDQSKEVDPKRIRYTGRTALIISLSLALLFTTNYLVNKANTYWDVSYLRSAIPSEASEKLFTSLTKELKILLFYPHESEVLNELNNYFSMAKSFNDKIIVEVYDFVYSPEEADKYKVSDNGQIVFVSDKLQETLKIASNIRDVDTFNKLQNLDENIYTNVLKVSRSKRIAYFTKGHGERATYRIGEKKRFPVSNFKKMLQLYKIDVREIGITDGLGEKVPDDASMLFIIDPQQKFLASELTSIDNYLKKGGYLFLTLDSQNNSEYWVEFLKTFNIELSPYSLATSININSQMKLFPDASIIIGNNYSSHAAVTTLKKHGAQAITFFPTSVSLAKVKKNKDSRFKVDIAIKSDSKTWIDYDGDYKKSGRSEKEGTYGLMATVSCSAKDKSKKSGTKQAVFKPKSNNKPRLTKIALKNVHGLHDDDDDDANLKQDNEEKVPDEGENKPVEQVNDDYVNMRMIVLADTDAISDAMLMDPNVLLTGRIRGVPPNQVIPIDCIKWMSDDEKLIGDFSKDKDAPILRTSEENRMIFWLLNVGIPIVIIGIGILFLILRKRKSKNI